jgi:hypothetical protein
MVQDLQPVPTLFVGIRQSFILQFYFSSFHPSRLPITNDSHSGICSLGLGIWVFVFTDYHLPITFLPSLPFLPITAFPLGIWNLEFEIWNLGLVFTAYRSLITAY